MSEITPITEWPAYEDNPFGGDPVTQNLNVPYDKGDLCWLLVATIICWQITPAIGFLYAGMHRRKSALTMVFQSLFCASACGIQFWVYGYSLYQSHTTGPGWGDLSLAGLHNVGAQPSLANSGIPDILYAAFGMTFVTATAMILAGAMLERGRLFPSMVFLLCWTTFVYYVLAYWEWNPSGWLYKLGVYDFAGSGPVHIASGFGALAWSIMLGPRVRHEEEAATASNTATTTTTTTTAAANSSSPATASGEMTPPAAQPEGAEKTAATTAKPRRQHVQPHNPFLVGLGTVFIWFGWFAFNGASTANLSLRSIYVVVNTNLAACGGGLAWSALEYVHEHLHSRKRQNNIGSSAAGDATGGTASPASGGGGGGSIDGFNTTASGGKFSIVGFCSGIIAGLVGITPAAGYVPVYTAALVGALTAVCSFYVVRHKHRLVIRGRAVDDGLDIFAIHGVGGVVGDILTGFFAATFVPALDGASGSTYAGGWWERNWVQMGYQLAAALTCAAWSFVVSCLLLFIIDKIPGLHLRATEEEELRGLDFKYLSDSTFSGGGGGVHGDEEEGLRRWYAVQAYEGVPVPVNVAMPSPADAKGIEVKRD
ncbi:ammonium transporter AmtB-like domain-containing protein [Microdochium bolleyi]|uniref:Ammonium transporter AmtB-like domain-containing protein n=1 Tax=Microdochium bolleyi TaxID=196109 RepID=A0A136J4J2_9PEZI|nr:ammonium transporter AmtB-like domain-containing protein [Microdochium bolleyi]